jgi:hypothetical protein
MKYLKTYNELKEALKPSVFRDYMNVWQENPDLRKRYEDIFKKYDGDKNHYRIYLPLVDIEKVDNIIENEIVKFLTDNNYEVIDYQKGICKFKEAKNTSKIGQVLTKLKNDDLMKKFVEDPIRKSGIQDDKLVCISRHPYDIAGSDTDRGWSNCMTISISDQKSVSSSELLKARSSLNLLKKEEEDLSEKEEDLINKIDRIRINWTTANDEDSDEALELEDKLYDIQHELDSIRHEIDQLEYNNGIGVPFLMNDIKEGSLIAYLIYKNDKNINKPIANLNIKPYINSKDKSDIVLLSDEKMYGQGSESFKNTIDKWLEEVNGKKVKKDGVYHLNPDVYNDDRNYVDRTDNSK